ncbi:MAG TPA: YraN family protein [Thermoanaerobaculia bacterium]|jgi:putative endonuclease|nr:YraN family protein [Thermoanaerobaculia bacterium]
MPAEFELQTHNRGRGKVGEEDAVRWLQTQGFVILERNVVTHAGEIDLVAREGETLCFVEVKARGTAAYGPAIAAVGPAKQRRICRAAALYLALRGLSGACRFDVLGLDAGENGWTYTLIRNAFPYQG